MPTLILLRHAQAVDLPPGGVDADRPLTELGQDQARRAAAQIGQLAAPSMVLISPATRTRQTAGALSGSAARVLAPLLYTEGADAIASLIADTDASIQTVVVVGHAPALPGLAYDLADPDTADAAAYSLLQQGFPAATSCRFVIDQTWANLSDAVLTDTWHHR